MSNIIIDIVLIDIVFLAIGPLLLFLFNPAGRRDQAKQIA